MPRHTMQRVVAEADILNPTDKLLFEEMFAPMGVTKTQFNLLMSSATKYKTSDGTVLVPGGKEHMKVMLLLRGEALAYAHPPEEAAEGRGVAKRRYTGRLHESEEEDVDVALRSRGSIIGGGGLVDTSVMNQLFKFDVVASGDVEWVEWDGHVLSELLRSPRMHGVQASFFRALYVEALQKLDTARIIRRRHSSNEESDQAVAVTPETKQLLSLFAFVAVPFAGFGFADNFIMILCGDMIDAKFGVAFGLSTMAAAGLGNWVSDAVGLGLGDAIERAGGKIGLNNGGLTRAQESMRAARITSLMGKIIGISVGCFLGMVPLLFRQSTKTEFTKEDLELFDQVFRPHGVSTAQFVQLLAKGTRKSCSSGNKVVQGGVPLGKIVLLCNGHAVAYNHGEGADGNLHDASCRYVGRLEGKQQFDQHLQHLVSHGSVMGGKALAEPDVRKKMYPNDIYAVTSVEWVEWGVEDLLRLMEEESSIQASFYSVLFGEILQTLRSSACSNKQKTKHYQSIVAAVIADGLVTAQEREVLEDYKEKLSISDEVHWKMLRDLGWTQEAWINGSKDGHRRIFLSSTNDHTTHLQEAIEIIEGVAYDLR